MKLIAILVLIIVTELHLAHSIRYFNKRQPRSQTSPQLTLDVLPHPGAHPTPVITEVTESTADYHFPAENSTLNFICTIKHATARYNIVIQKQDRETKEITDLLTKGEYEISQNLDKERFKVIFEDYIENNVNFYKLTFTINRLKLSDNGIYKCTYNKITKQVNALIYKQLKPSDVVFPASTLPKTNEFEVDTEYSFGCRAFEVYPKPMVRFEHSGGEDLTQFVSEKDLTHPPNDSNDAYYSITISSSLNYTIKYTDHLKNLSCIVNNTVNSSEVKSILLQVIGMKVLDDLCKRTQDVKDGSTSVKLTCNFFANPKPDVIEWHTKKPTDQQQQQKPETPASTNEAGAENADQQQPAQLVEPEDDKLKLSDDFSSDEYQVTINDLGSHIYEAVLEIKDVKLDHHKPYNLYLGQGDKVLSTEIKLTSEVELRNQRVTASTGILSNFHSNLLVLVSSLATLAFTFLF